MNNVGIGIGGPIEWTPLEHMKHTADVNLWGMIDVTKTFLPLIKKSQGRVVNLSSMAGEFPGSLPGEGGRDPGRDFHIKNTEVLVKNFEKNPQEVSRYCFVGVA